jgi:hypothetical protein
MAVTRRRFKQTTSPKDRLTAFAKEVREKAEQLASGLERDATMKKSRQADIAAHIDEWANSSGLQPPK